MCSGEKEREGESACVCKSRGGVVSASLSSVCTPAKSSPHRERERESESEEAAIEFLVLVHLVELTK